MDPYNRYTVYNISIWLIIPLQEVIYKFTFTLCSLFNEFITSSCRQICGNRSPIVAQGERHRSFAKSSSRRNLPISLRETSSADLFFNFFLRFPEGKKSHRFTKHKSYRTRHSSFLEANQRVLAAFVWLQQNAKVSFFYTERWAFE